jgi:tetraacyldisaccharide 4'-kinase
VNPLGAIYGGVVLARNGLYTHGIVKPRRLSAPVISVGNISVGGSGKTPFVILLGGLLQQRGIPFDVLSRGYGRQTRGILAVDPNGSAREFGDEPILIAKHLGCGVVVGENRYQAGLFAENKFGPQLHILDDGFQHRFLARDFEIVLLSPEDVHDQLLPAGRLREPRSSLRRADAIVVTAESTYPELKIDGPCFWHLRRNITITGAPPRPVAFCGVARPQQFIDQLRTAGIQPVATKFFRDHYSYTERDARDLTALRQQSAGGGFITTEKDAINLGPLFSSLNPVAVACVIMELFNPADAVDTILRAIRESRPQP